jgi:hypothetical protein
MDGSGQSHAEDGDTTRATLESRTQAILLLKRSRPLGHGDDERLEARRVRRLDVQSEARAEITATMVFRLNGA